MQPLTHYLTLIACAGASAGLLVAQAQAESMPLRIVIAVIGGGFVGATLVLARSFPKQ